MEGKPLPNPGDSVLGHEILRVAGEGAMGVVYEARDQEGNIVALKLLKPDKAADPQAVKAFEDEAVATDAVKQKNVVAVLGHGAADGYHYIRMEFVDGPPLDRLIEFQGRIPWREAAKTIIQVARALAQAHVQGFVHRDVKPDNILLYKDGRARLTDFGIVKDISSLKGYLLPGKKVGTAAYASPEQCLGKRLGPGTDMYSLGATFYHMVCGRPPFAAETASKVMVGHVKEKLVPPVERIPDIPKPVSNIIEKMLAKRVGDRPEKMELLIDDLIRLVKGQVAITRKPSLRSRRSGR